MITARYFIKRNGLKETIKGEWSKKNGFKGTIKGEWSIKETDSRERLRENGV